jgi:hypothetical protein
MVAAFAADEHSPKPTVEATSADNFPERDR